MNKTKITLFKKRIKLPRIFAVHNSQLKSTTLYYKNAEVVLFGVKSSCICEKMPIFAFQNHHI
jgi:hypothetical protein